MRATVATDRESNRPQVLLSPFLSLLKNLHKLCCASKITSVVGSFPGIITLQFTIASCIYVTSFTKFVTSDLLESVGITAMT